jgi:hypothetical protein
MANAVKNTPMDGMKKLINAVAFGTVDELRAAKMSLYKISVNDVKQMGYDSIRSFLQKYIHPMDGTDFQGMTLLHIAVLTGEPDIVNETLTFGIDLETLSGATLDPEFAQKTPRGLADVLIVRSKIPEAIAVFKAIKSILLQRGAKPKMKTTIMGKKLAFPENAANVQTYKNAVAAVNRMLGPSMSRKSRKNRKARKTRKNKTRRA